MSNNPLTEILSPKARRIVYAVYAALGIAFGATQVGFATAGGEQPSALLVAFAVFGYLGTALGLVAASNTPTTVDETLEAADDAGEHEAPYTGA